MGATGHRWEGRWRAGSPAPATRASDSPHGDRRAARSPRCGVVGWAAAWGRGAAEKAVGDARRLAHTGRSAVSESVRHTAGAPWSVSMWA
jgi:hypothetical protein